MFLASMIVVEYFVWLNGRTKYTPELLGLAITEDIEHLHV